MMRNCEKLCVRQAAHRNFNGTIFQTTTCMSYASIVEPSDTRATVEASLVPSHMEKVAWYALFAHAQNIPLHFLHTGPTIQEVHVVIMQRNIHPYHGI